MRGTWNNLRALASPGIGWLGGLDQVRCVDAFGPPGSIPGGRRDRLSGFQRPLLAVCVAVDWWLISETTGEPSWFTAWPTL